MVSFRWLNYERSPRRKSPGTVISYKGFLDLIRSFMPVILYFFWMYSYRFSPASWVNTWIIHSIVIFTMMIHVLFVTVKLFFKLSSPHEQCNALVIHDYPGAPHIDRRRLSNTEQRPPYPLLDIALHEPLIRVSSTPSLFNLLFSALKAATSPSRPPTRSLRTLTPSPPFTLASIFPSSSLKRS